MAGTHRHRVSQPNLLPRSGRLPFSPCACATFRGLLFVDTMSAKTSDSAVHSPAIKKTSGAWLIGWPWRLRLAGYKSWADVLRLRIPARHIK